jgi:hypothetical protein
LRGGFFLSIVPAELAEDEDLDILMEFAGDKNLMDHPGLKNRGLPGGDRPRGGHPSPRAALRPFPKERILNEQVPTLKE